MSSIPLEGTEREVYICTITSAVSWRLSLVLSLKINMIMFPCQSSRNSTVTPWFYMTSKWLLQWREGALQRNAIPVSNTRLFWSPTDLPSQCGFTEHQSNKADFSAMSIPNCVIFITHCFLHMVATEQSV